MDNDNLVSVGYDRRPIVWNMFKNSQKIYDTQLSSLDCVTSPNKYCYLTGSETGEICLWNIAKRKPQITLQQPHQNGWISALACVKNTDLVVSGANDGKLIFYKGNFDNLKTLSLEKMFSIDCEGIVNDIQIS